MNYFTFVLSVIEYRVSERIFCGVHKALYKKTQKTGTELPYCFKFRMSGRIVDQKMFGGFAVLFSRSEGS